MTQLTLEHALQLAVAHHNAGRFAEAEGMYRQILSAQPDQPDALHLWGLLAQRAGDRELAVGLIRRAVAARPDFPRAWAALGVLALEAGRFDEAIEAYHRAIARLNDNAGWHNNLGLALMDAGQVQEAIESFDRAIALEPGNASFGSARVSSLLYHPGLDAGRIAEEHFKWGRRHADGLAKETPPHRDVNRRIRIGYVSADLRQHPVGRFLLPVVEHHNRDQFEIFCYSDVTFPDAITARFQASADTWRPIARLDHDAVTKQVRTDGIDILVDLAGHTSGNRLMVFARKPAPVQVSYLGYPATTGMMAMDYRLTDAVADPPGMTEHLHTEKLIRLPKTNWCFSEPMESPERVADDAGPVRFCCFNNFTKVTGEMLAVWGRILKEVPESTLALKAGALTSASRRERVRLFFSSRGIDPQRVILEQPLSDYRSHLSRYGQMDIALDTYPYHGTTTTCEAMWMGVPVVALAGHSHVSRVGVSLLSSIGLTQLIASSVDEYVTIAADLAADHNRLRTMQSQLRQRMKQSALMDVAGVVGDVESAYRRLCKLAATSTASQD